MTLVSFSRVFERLKAAKMQLQKSIKYLITLCQIFGLVPFSRNKKQLTWKGSRFNEIIAIVYLSITIVYFVLCLIYNEFFVDESESGLQRAIICYSIAIIYLHVFVVLIEHFWKRFRQIKLLNLFRKLELMMKSQDEFQLNYARIQRVSCYSVFFWAMQTCGLMCFNVVLLIESKDIPDFFFAISYAMPFILSKLSFIYSMNLVSILHKNMDALIQYTQAFCENVDKDDRKKIINMIVLETINRNDRMLRGKAIDVHKVAFLKQFYASIWEASVLINGLFYWSWVVGLMNESSILVFNCFFFTMNLLSKSQASLLSTMYLVVWTVMHVMNIMFVTFTCGNAAQTVIMDKMCLGAFQIYLHFF